MPILVDRVDRKKKILKFQISLSDRLADNLWSKFMKKWIFLLLIPFQVQALQLEIRSSHDGAAVFEMKDEEKILLGKTPLKLDQFDNQNSRLLVVEKKGFVPVYFPVSNKLTDHVVSKIKLVKINEWEPDSLKYELSQKAEAVVDDILLAQFLLDQRRTAEATVKLDELKASYPDNVSIGIIYANSLLLQGKVQEAKTYYEALLNRIPDERKVLKDMVTKMFNNLKRKS